MAKIHPHPVENKNVSSDHSPSEREAFTVWMKSLVFHSNGCTVFNCRGEVAFRVDNYQQRCCREVFLMDSNGHVLFSVTRKGLGIFGSWEGYKWNMDDEVKRERSTPCFQVRRNPKISGKDTFCQVSMGSEKTCYRIRGTSGGKSKERLRITDISGRVLAEAAGKESKEGVRLGDDVLTLMVEAHVDASLVVALVIVYALICNKL